MEDISLTKTAVLAGCGAMSKGWLKAILEAPEVAGRVEVVGLVDLDPAVAQARADEFGLSGAVIGTDLDALTIGWLIDSRAGGRRIATYLDVTTALQVPEGFPWSRVHDPVADVFPAPTPLGYPSDPAASPKLVTPVTYDDPWADDE